MKSKIRAKYLHNLPSVGDKIVEKKFALLPKKLITSVEFDLIEWYWVWLESYYVFKEYQRFVDKQKALVYYMWIVVEEYQDDKVEKRGELK